MFMLSSFVLILFVSVNNVLTVSGTSYTENNDTGRTIKLTVFYETLCPYSMKFFQEQLSRLFVKDTQLYRYVNFDLVPYGNAKQIYSDEEGMWKTVCQHGPLECKYNTLHACVATGVSYAKSNTINQQFVQFLICLMGSKREDMLLERCAARYNVQVDWVNHCLNGKTGKKLLARLGYKTRRFSPHIESVPAIVINDKYSSSNQELAITNLPKLICQNLSPKPRACNRIDEKVYTSDYHDF